MYTAEHIFEMREFNRFYTDLIGLLDNHLLNSDYSLAEARVLFEIFNSGKISSTDIVDRLSIDKSYLSRILKKFEKLELIIKTISEADARVLLISLTASGQKVFKELDASSNKQIQTLIEGIPIIRLVELVEHMRAIRHILKKNSDK